MGKQLKKHKSIDEQIELLKSRGLIIDDEEKARKVLSSINYYRLTGYLYEFKLQGTDHYIGTISFETIIELYDFDCKLTRILMYALENVEETFKTRFSYTLSSAYPNNPRIYMYKSIYRDENKLNKFRNLFRRAKKQNKELPFIKHHYDYYDGQLPIWVAVEIMTMGNLNSLYDNLQSNYQKAIAKQYNTGPMQLKSWLENVTYTRNHLAHYMRIYGYDFGRSPKDCRNHIQMTHSGKIFDQIIAMGFMYSDENDWNNYVVPEIKKVIEKYSDLVELEKIGFPIDWENQLLSINQ